MPTYRVNLSVGFDNEAIRLLAMSSDSAAELFPNQIGAIARMADIAHKKWISYASGEPLPDGKTIRRWTGSYAQSIKIEHDGQLRYEIFSDSPLAEVIEYGRDAWDMKQLLWSSHKVRENKEGKRYMVFPFRWGTPNTIVLGQYAGREMPVMVHQWFLSREQSMITSDYTEKSLQDGTTDVTRYRYQWGDRLSQKDVAALGLDPHSDGKNLVGMVRMKSQMGSQYLTFRTMSEESEGWVNPKREARQPAKHVYDFLMQHYETVMQMAQAADIDRLLKQT